MYVSLLICFHHLNLAVFPTLCFTSLSLHLMFTEITGITQILSTKAKYFESQNLLNVVLMAGPSAAGPHLGDSCCVCCAT